ncbi:hypothetical protein OE749_16755 [Aestuariibacter sp. AA17]|uniref:Uncharacterized protein n=1 Tax=Fluctibacter corallii TaxID=2984329 RepID=A0ABT3ACE8_9ALTE|nr:hypothetical protein [Aestuariibacter sp. AA17]MCV2886347.1 hypothetical protein [Aestuariibacter sp. AA17]
MKVLHLINDNQALNIHGGSLDDRTSPTATVVWSGDGGMPSTELAEMFNINSSGRRQGVSFVNFHPSM